MSDPGPSGTVLTGEDLLAALRDGLVDERRRYIGAITDLSVVYAPDKATLDLDPPDGTDSFGYAETEALWYRGVDIGGGVFEWQASSAPPSIAASPHPPGTWKVIAHYSDAAYNERIFNIIHPSASGFPAPGLVMHEVWDYDEYRISIDAGSTSSGNTVGLQLRLPDDSDWHAWLTLQGGVRTSTGAALATNEGLASNTARLGPIQQFTDFRNCFEFQLRRTVDGRWMLSGTFQHPTNYVGNTLDMGMMRAGSTDLLADTLAWLRIFVQEAAPEEFSTFQITVEAMRHPT